MLPAKAEEDGRRQCRRPPKVLLLAANAPCRIVNGRITSAQARLRERTKQRAMNKSITMCKIRLQHMFDAAIVSP
jgi:hypothetical protein